MTDHGGMEQALSSRKEVKMSEKINTYSQNGRFVGQDGERYQLTFSEGKYYLRYSKIVDEPPYGDQFHELVDIVDPETGKTLGTKDLGNSLSW